VGQQVDLVEYHHIAGAKQVRVFDRLILALGYRHDNDFLALAEIEELRG
jgi:hypothetical protein